MLMKKNVLDFNDFNTSALNQVHELLGEGVSLQLISAIFMVIPVNGFYVSCCFCMFLMMGLMKLEECKVTPFCEGEMGFEL